MKKTILMLAVLAISGVNALSLMAPSEECKNDREKPHCVKYWNGVATASKNWTDMVNKTDPCFSQSLNELVKNPKDLQRCFRMFEAPITKALRVK